MINNMISNVLLLDIPKFDTWILFPCYPYDHGQSLIVIKKKTYAAYEYVPFIEKSKGLN